MALLTRGHGEHPHLTGEDEPVEPDGRLVQVRGCRVYHVGAGQEAAELGRHGCPAVEADGLEGVITHRRDISRQIAQLDGRDESGADGLSTLVQLTNCVDLDVSVSLQ